MLVLTPFPFYASTTAQCKVYGDVSAVLQVRFSQIGQVNNSQCCVSDMDSPVVYQYQHQ